jgi:hypothetical protein
VAEIPASEVSVVHAYLLFDITKYQIYRNTLGFKTWPETSAGPVWPGSGDPMCFPAAKRVCATLIRLLERHLLRFD